MAFKFSSKDEAARRAGRRTLLERKNLPSYDTIKKRRELLDERSRKLRISLSDSRGRVSEDVVSRAVLKYLMSLDDGEASISELRSQLPRLIDLSKADLKSSESRPSEPVWTQQIRNIVSHRDIPGNAISEGLLAYLGSGKLSITDEGKTAVLSGGLLETDDD